MKIIFSVIIVNYHSKVIVEKCVESLIRFNSDINYEIIIVDNSQPNEKFSFKNFPCRVVVIKNKFNYGFSKAVNIGIANAKGKYFVLVNPDIEFYKPIFKEIKSILKKNNDIKIATTKILNTNGSIQASFWKKYGIFNHLLRVFFNIKGKWGTGYYFFNPKLINKIDIITGAFMIIEAKIIDKLYGFDEKIFLYAEDTEFCLRARKLNIYSYYLPIEGIIHHEHGTSNSISNVLKYAFKSRMYVIKKHFSRGYYYIFYVLTIIELLYRGFIFKTIGKFTNNKRLIFTGIAYLSEFKKFVKISNR